MNAPQSDLTPAQRRQAFDRAIWDLDDYLTRKAAEEAAQQTA